MVTSQVLTKLQDNFLPSKVRSAGCKVWSPGLVSSRLPATDLQEAAGSHRSRWSRSKLLRVSSVGRAPGSYPECRWFESSIRNQLQGFRQAGPRHRVLIPTFPGSNPGAPSTINQRQVPADAEHLHKLWGECRDELSRSGQNISPLPIPKPWPKNRGFFMPVIC